MTWFRVNVTNEEGESFADEIRAFNEREARITIENLGFTINRIQRKRVQSFATWCFEAIDRRIRPRRYDYIQQLKDLGVGIDDE